MEIIRQGSWSQTFEWEYDLILCVAQHIAQNATHKIVSVLLYLNFFSMHLQNCTWNSAAFISMCVP